MKIKQHRLTRDDGTPYPFVPSPNVGGSLKPEFLVIHFTAGGGAESSVKWMANAAAKASAHLVIGRDGGVTQMVPFDTVAWHAGKSRWEDRVGLNRYSIGMELDNAGRLTRSGDRWRSWFGREYAQEEVLVAVHKNETEPSGWHAYTEEQIDAALQVASLLVGDYDLLDVVGHDDIAPGRKQDPGPAFPLEHFRARLFGRTEDEDAIYKTTAVLNIRQGPGTQHQVIEGNPLPEATRVMVLEERGSWRFVDVMDVVHDVMDMQGWVLGRLLRRAR